MNTSKLSTLTASTKAVAQKIAKCGIHGLVCAVVALFAVGTWTASAQSTLTWDITPGTVGTGNGTITGGGGTWNTSNGNWTTDAGTNNVSWVNAGAAPMNNAIIGGTAGWQTVTLGEAISLKNLTFSNIDSPYTLTGFTLNFTAGTITASVPLTGTGGTAAIIKSNITGSPAINLQPMDGDELFVLNPVAGGSMIIGAVSGDGGDGSEKLNLQGGAGSTGTIASVTGPKVVVTAGSWTLNGASTGRDHSISGGALTLKANLTATKRAVILSGTGVINYNVANAVTATAASNVSTDNGFRITGGSLDQTSGAAINANTSTTHIDLGGTLTFLGSNGANSDLHLGSGPVWLKDGNRTITVTTAATTLTIGGVIQNDDTAGRSLTKAGAGTLELRGVNTYTGATTVNAGTLSGTGTIAGPVTVGALGSIAPGSKVARTGTLTINNNCTITNNLNITVNGTLSSKLVVTNALTIVSGATINVTEITPPPTGALVIASYNTLVGTFATVNSTTSMVVDHNYQGLKQIALIVPPAGTVILFH